MKQLNLRVAAAVGAATLLGGMTSGAIHTLWMRRQAAQSGAVVLGLKAAQVQQAYVSGTRNALDLSELSKATVLGEPALEGQHRNPPRNLVGAPREQWVVAEGEAWLGFSVGENQRVWVGQSMNALLTSNSPPLAQSLGLLVGVWLLVWFVALGLLNRWLLRPLQRVTRLATDGDTLGLSSLASSGDDITRLGHSLASMNDRLATDKERIAKQLDELTITHSELKETQSQLVRAERLALVGQLSAGLAHEIGNPLGVLQGFVDLLAAGQSPEDEKAALSRMNIELNRIQKTLGDLLDFSRAPSRAQGSCHPASAVEHVLALIAPQKRFAGVEVSVHDESAGASVSISEDALIQVLLNIMFNAADALDGQGTILVRIDVVDHDVCVVIEDSGPGLVEEIRSRLFEPFFSTKDAGRGTGLGLCVCQQILEAAGGSITAGASETQGGAKFSVRVPKSPG